MSFFKMFKLASNLAVEISRMLVKESENAKTKREFELILRIANFIERRTF